MDNKHHRRNSSYKQHEIFTNSSNKIREQLAQASAHGQTQPHPPSAQDSQPGVQNTSVSVSGNAKSARATFTDAHADTTSENTSPKSAEPLFSFDEPGRNVG